METVQIHKSEITDLILFKRSIKFLSNTLDEVELKCVEHDIIVEGMDPSRICLFRFKIKDILEKPLNTKLFINVEDLEKILTTIKKDTLPIEIQKKKGISDNDLLTMKPNNEKFTLKLLGDYDYEDIPIENLQKIEYDVKHPFSHEDLRDIVKKGMLYSEIIGMRFDNMGMEFYSKGMLGDYTRDEGMVKKQGESNYSLTFMKMMLVNSKQLFKEDLILHLKKDHPLRVEYKDSLIEYDNWLAPRVEEADDWDDDDDMEDF